MTRLSDEIAKIKANLQKIQCEVCHEPMGYVEGEAPAAYCSDKCIRAVAKDNLS